MNDLSGLRALGQMLVASARKPKVGELGSYHPAGPATSYYSYLPADYPDITPPPHSQELLDKIEAAKVRLAARQLRIVRLRDGLQVECQKDHDDEETGIAR